MNTFLLFCQPKTVTRRERWIPEPRRKCLWQQTCWPNCLKTRLKSNFEIIHAFRSRQRSEPHHLTSVRPFLVQEGLKSQCCSVKRSALVSCGRVDPVPSHSSWEVKEQITQTSCNQHCSKEPITFLHSGLVSSILRLSSRWFLCAPWESGHSPGTLGCLSQRDKKVQMSSTSVPTNDSR